MTSQERTDFWAKPAPPAAADLRPAAAAPRAEEPAITRASWPAPADAPTPPAAEPARRSATTTAVAAQPLSTSGSPSRAAARDGDGRRQDRLFPARLLVVIVIAALIGSALVLLLK